MLRSSRLTWLPVDSPSSLGRNRWKGRLFHPRHVCAAGHDLPTSGRCRGSANMLADSGLRGRPHWCLCTSGGDVRRSYRLLVPSCPGGTATETASAPRSAAPASQTDNCRTTRLPGNFLVQSFFSKIVFRISKVVSLFLLFRRGLNRRMTQRFGK